MGAFNNSIVNSSIMRQRLLSTLYNAVRPWGDHLFYGQGSVGPSLVGFFGEADISDQQNFPGQLIFLGHEILRN